MFSKSEPDSSGEVAVVFACNNALADTLATFTVGGLIQNLKRYLTEPNLDPDALTAEMTTVFEHLWNSFTSEARGETP